MRRIFTIVYVIFLFQVCLNAQLHEDVFPGESGAALITKLRLEFKPSTVLSYGDAREVMYRDLYNENDSVTCVYSGHQLYLNPNTSDPIGDLILGGTANGINCEHTFPQSKGAGSGNARSDMHHLFPARAKVNEARLNYPFSEVEDRNTERWFYKDGEQSSIPNQLIDAYSELGDDVFEPREDHKGNVARAIFYFYAIYRESADASFFSGQRSTLCQWHYDDPVDQKEWENNLTISTYQSDKKNPFILDCSLAERTFCPDITGVCETTDVLEVDQGIQRIFPNPTTGDITIEWVPGVNPENLTVINAQGKEVLRTEVLRNAQQTNIASGSLPKGLYFLNIEDRNGRWIIKAASFLIQ